MVRKKGQDSPRDHESPEIGIYDTDIEVDSYLFGRDGTCGISRPGDCGRHRRYKTFGKMNFRGKYQNTNERMFKRCKSHSYADGVFRGFAKCDEIRKTERSEGVFRASARVALFDQRRGHSGDFEKRMSSCGVGVEKDHTVRNVGVHVASSQRCLFGYRTGGNGRNLVIRGM